MYIYVCEINESGEMNILIDLKIYVKDKNMFTSNRKRAKVRGKYIR